jgi:AcrR family transcriptional regulator
MQQRSEETRNRILDAAYRQFGLQGYEAASVASICQAAGVSKGAFYHHFPTKQSIFMAILESWLANLDAGFATSRLQAQSVPDALLDMAAAAGAVMHAADVDLTILLEFWTAAARDPVVWQATLAPYQRYLDYFATLIQEGISEGSFQPVQPEQTAKALVSMALGILMRAVFDRTVSDWSQEVQQSLEIFLNGIKRRNE